MNTRALVRVALPRARSGRALFCFAISLVALAISGVRLDAIDATTIEFYQGSPFGIARVRHEVAEPSSLGVQHARFTVVGDHSRALYPVFFADPVPADATGALSTPHAFELFFLFRGDEPIKVSATTNLDRGPYTQFNASFDPGAVDRAIPEARREQLMRRWWEGYRSVLAATRVRNETYPLVENYLNWYLPRRLELGEAELPGIDAAIAVTARPLSPFPEFEEIADLLMGTESIRIAMQRDVLLETRAAREAPTTPLPKPVTIWAVNFPAREKEADIEAFASVVPEECLYVRFPTFKLFRSLRERLETIGGGIHDLVLGRAFDANVRARLETQLALKETVLSKLLGDVVIGEVAIIAQDTFVREGSAIGFIFEAKNSPLLLASINRLRAEAIEESQTAPGGAAEESELVLPFGTARRLLSPGNRVRSFYAIAGKYHLVSNSEKLTERFLECASKDGESSLARDPGFLHCRDLYPASEREDGFVFISDPFIRELVGPAYRVEMTRRTRARSIMELIEVARLTARAERGKELSVDELVEQGYLPESVSEEPDGARFELAGHAVVDSLRGERGAFTPIPDMNITSVTRSEAASYETFRRFYRSQWGRVDPVAIRLRLTRARTLQGVEEEHWDAEVDILPFAVNAYRMLAAFMGPAKARTIEPLRDELLSLEAEIGAFVERAPSWVRLGFVDFEPSVALDGDAIVYENSFGDFPGYAIIPYERRADGSLSCSFLGIANRVTDAESEADREFYTLGERWSGATLWALPRDEEVLVIAESKRIARRMVEEMRFIDSTEAQARLNIAPLGKKKIARMLALQSSLRQRRASRSGARFLSRLHEVFKVPLEDCPTIASRVLSADVVCPSGRIYDWHKYPQRGGFFFQSGAYPDSPTPVSASALLREAKGHSSSILDTFRGLQVGFRFGDLRSIHSDIRLRFVAPPEPKPVVETRDLTQ